MATIKIGKVEEQLIDEIERIKEKQRMRMVGVYLGVKLARKQILDTKNEEVRLIIQKIDKTINCVEHLKHAIQGIVFSKEHDAERFSVSWEEFNDSQGSYFKYTYGKNFTVEPVTEKQFMFAVLSWEREVCKQLAVVKEIEGYSFEDICDSIEQDIRRALHTYMRDA